MELSGETLIGAPPAKVWEALTDPAFLAACRQDETATGAATTTRDGTVLLSDLDPPTGCTVSLPGQGSGASVRLQDAGAETTRLSYGKAGTAYETFFARFAAAVSHGVAAPGGPATASAQLKADGKAPDTVLPGLEQVPPGVGAPPHDPKAHVAHPAPFHPPAHEDHDHDPSNPHVFGIPAGVLIAGFVAAVSVCITLYKFLH